MILSDQATHREQMQEGLSNRDNGPNINFAKGFLSMRPYCFSV